MSNYVETKNKIDVVRNKYGCKGDLIFRTAITTLFDCGKSLCADDMWLKNMICAIDDEYDDAESAGKHLFMTKDFEKAIYECAHELAAFKNNDLFIYIQKEVWFGDDGIDYQRSIYLLKGCIAWVLSDTYETEYALQEVREMGFDDDEIEKLGFGWMLDAEEEEE